MFNALQLLLILKVLRSAVNFTDSGLWLMCEISQKLFIAKPRNGLQIAELENCLNIVAKPGSQRQGEHRQYTIGPSPLTRPKLIC